MNEYIKAKWVSALRSGEYKQTTRYLKNDNGFCCLGVLCEISAAETGFGIAKNLVETKGHEDLGGTIMRWSGIKNTHGDSVTINGANKFLSEANDDGATFSEIADAIEAQL